MVRAANVADFSVWLDQQNVLTSRLYSGLVCRCLHYIMVIIVGSRFRTLI